MLEVVIYDYSTTSDIIVWKSSLKKINVFVEMKKSYGEKKGKTGN